MYEHLYDPNYLPTWPSYIVIGDHFDYDPATGTLLTYADTFFLMGKYDDGRRLLVFTERLHAERSAEKVPSDTAIVDVADWKQLAHHLRHIRDSMGLQLDVAFDPKLPRFLGHFVRFGDIVR